MTLRRIALLLGLVATWVPTAPRAEEAAGDAATYAVDGSVTSGYRMVDIDGSKDKYREDYNLRSGGRLFALDVDGRSREPDKTPLDRFHLEVDTPGDEPVSLFRLSAADRSLYDLRVNFIRSKYFYAVPQLFAQPVAGDVRLDDLHDWNLTRTDGSVDLTVHAPHLPTLLFGYRLYERSGDTTSTVSIPGGDTFLVRAPLDTVTNVGRVGTEFRALDTDVFLQQEYRRVDRSLGEHGPHGSGGSAGLDPTDASTLTQWDSHEDEHLDIPATTVRLRHPVGDDVDLTGAYFYSRADLGFHGAQRRDGTSNVPAYSGVATATDHGNGTLDTHVADLGTTWRMTDWASAHASYRFNERSQTGALDEPSTYGLLATATGDHVRVQSMTGDIELAPRADLSVGAGVRYARRDARFSVTGQDTVTDTIGALGDVRYRPWSFLDLYARYEGATVDDPLVVPGDPSGSPALPAREIALTFVNRGTTGLRLRLREWLALSYEFIADSRENDTFAARSQSFANSLGLSLTPLAGLTIFTGYTHRDLDNHADILLAPLYARSRSIQDGTENVLTSELRYDFRLLGQGWSTGWNIAYVDADNRLAPRLEPGLLGSTFYDLDRIDGGGFLTLHHHIIEPAIEFRMIDYHERARPQNDYRATIFAFKLRKAFDFGF